MGAGALHRLSLAWPAILLHSYRSEGLDQRGSSAVPPSHARRQPQGTRPFSRGAPGRYLPAPRNPQAPRTRAAMGRLLALLLPLLAVAAVAEVRPTGGGSGAWGLWGLSGLAQPDCMPGCKFDNCLRISRPPRCRPAQPALSLPRRPSHAAAPGRCRPMPHLHQQGTDPARHRLPARRHRGDGALRCAALRL